MYNLPSGQPDHSPLCSAPSGKQQRLTINITCQEMWDAVNSHFAVPVKAELKFK